MRSGQPGVNFDGRGGAGPPSKETAQGEHGGLTVSAHVFPPSLVICGLVPGIMFAGWAGPAPG